MRKSVETQFELRSGGVPLVSWMMQQRTGGASLRDIADAVTKTTGISVSHESGRRWMLEG
jgi:outer membrane receptor for ferric coprogen and ferric-rhodotorulic acid